MLFIILFWLLVICMFIVFVLWLGVSSDLREISEKITASAHTAEPREDESELIERKGWLLRMKRVYIIIYLIIFALFILCAQMAHGTEVALFILLGFLDILYIRFLISPPKRGLLAKVLDGRTLGFFLSLFSLAALLAFLAMLDEGENPSAGAMLMGLNILIVFPYRSRISKKKDVQQES